MKCYVFFSSVFSDIPIWMNEWSPTSIEHQIGRLPTASTIPYEIANNPLWDILSAILETRASECHLRKTMASQVLVVVKNPPANAGNVRDAGLIPGLGRSQEEGKATHSNILAWRIPWTEESGRLQSMGRRVGQDRARRQRCQNTFSDRLSPAELPY